MYILQFKKNRSKYFNEALSFAKELNCEFDGTTVTINIPENYLFNAYNTFRQLFGLIQNWKDTGATFRGEKVHPYKFILDAKRIYDCSEIKQCKDNYGNIAWGCHRINNILYAIKGYGNYKKNTVFWYNYGHFNGNKWVIDKDILFDKLTNFVNKKGIDLCPVYNENNVRFAVKNLPDYIIPDGINFKIHYLEKYVDGVKLQIKNNIRHVTEQTNVFKIN